MLEIFCNFWAIVMKASKDHNIQTSLKTPGARSQQSKGTHTQMVNAGTGWPDMCVFGLREEAGVPGEPTSVQGKLWNFTQKSGLEHRTWDWPFLHCAMNNTDPIGLRFNNLLQLKRAELPPCRPAISTLISTINVLFTRRHTSNLLVLIAQIDSGWVSHAQMGRTTHTEHKQVQENILVAQFYRSTILWNTWAERLLWNTFKNKYEH